MSNDLTADGHFLSPRTNATSEFQNHVSLDFANAGAEAKIRFPLLSPKQLQGVVADLKTAHSALRKIEIREILDVLGTAVHRWAEPSYPQRLQALELLPTVTGYSPETVRQSLDWVTTRLNRSALEELLTLELGNPRFLDKFCPRPGVNGYSKAFGPPLVTHFLSGNVPGLPALSIACALLTKSTSLCKVSSQEPVFPALFCSSIAEVSPELARSLAVLYWRGGDEALEREVLKESNAIIAYGGEDATSSLRRRCPPETRFLSYGHKVSFGVVAKEALNKCVAQEVALRAARDASVFDQQACLSAHVIYVEKGGELSAQEFAGLLAASMAAFNRATPRGRLSSEEAVAIYKLRELYEFKEYDGQEVRSHFSDTGSDWTVIYEDSPDFVPSCLNRVVRVKPIENLDELPGHVQPIQRYLQTVGVEAQEDRMIRLAEQLGALGVTRVCPLGQMTDHAISWHHDGRYNLLDLVRWTDLETSSQIGKEGE